MRFDTGSVPVGYLVLSSKTKTIGEIQDQALFKVRPMFASLPGVSAPPPFGGNQRHHRRQASIPTGMRILQRLARGSRHGLDLGNTISPSGNIRIKDQMPIVPVNTMVKDPKELGTIPLRPGDERLSPRRRHHRGQHRHSHRLCAGQWQAGRLHPGDQAGRRLHAVRGQRGPGQPAQDAGGLPDGHRCQLRVRSVALRDAGHVGRRRPKGCSCAVPDRPDGAGVLARSGAA